MPGAALSRGTSRQDLGTPWEFIHAVQTLFSEKIAWDLAANYKNAKADRYINKRENTFTVDWTKRLRGGIGWLNPEFDPVQPFIEKVVFEAKKGARLWTLTRGSIDADWYWLMEPLATIRSLSPRIIFDNQRDKKTGKLLEHPQGYPSACVLSNFNFEPRQPLSRWRWK